MGSKGETKREREGKRERKKDREREIMGGGIKERSRINVSVWRGKAEEEEGGREEGGGEG